MSWLVLSQPALGQEIFTQSFDVSSYLTAQAVAVDQTGIYVCLSGSGLTSGAGEWDYLVPRQLSTGAVLAKFASDGSSVWTHSIDTTELYFCAVSLGGNRVFLLTNRSSESGDFGLYAFTSDGDQLWDKRIEWANSISADADGVYVGGGQNTGGFLRRYDLTGKEVWSHAFPDFRLDSLVGNDGGVYAGGVSFGGTGGIALKRLSRDGAELWTRRFEDFELVRHLATDGTAVYSVRGWDPPAFVDKLDEEGNVLWSRANIAGPGVTVKGVAADSSGLYLAGLARGALPGSCRSGQSDGFVLKYNADGVLRWTRQYSKAGLLAEFNGAAIDSAGIYVAGQLSSALLARVDKTQAEIAESGPWIYSGCVVNAATYRGGQIAPREIVSIFGREIGPAEGVTPERTNGQPPRAAADTRVFFNDVAAQLLYVSAGQINAVAPDSVSNEDTVTISVEHGGVSSNRVTMAVGATSPGLFSSEPTGRGPLLALNSDGTLNSATNQADLGSEITLFATGLGLTNTVQQAYFCCYSDQVTPVGHLEVTPLSIPGLLQLRMKIPERTTIDALWGGPAGTSPLVIDTRDATTGFEGYLYIRNVYLNCAAHPDADHC